MKTIPKVDVNIVTYNSEQVIQACLNSVFQQTHINICVNIIDNHSTDNTIGILSKYPVNVFMNRINFGYAKAHNQALAKSNGKYIVTLNPDVVLDKRFITNLVREMEHNSTVGSCSGFLLRVDDVGMHSDSVDAAGIYMRRNRRQGLRYENVQKKHVPTKNEYIFGPDGAAAFYRRKMLTDIMYRKEIFDEDFYMYKEDVDICWRAQLFGWKSLFVPSAIAQHRRSFRPGDRKGIPQNLRLFSVRNRYFLMIKNEIARLYFRDIFWILLYEIKIIGYIITREPLSFLAYFQVIKKFPLMKKKRIDIQKHTRVNDQYMQQWFTS